MDYKAYLLNYRFKIRQLYSNFVSNLKLYLIIDKNELLTIIRNELKKLGYEINDYKISSKDSSILLIRIDTNKNGLICKITLNENQLNSLQKNFNSLHLLNKTDLIPKSILKIKYKKHIIFIEELIPGKNGLELILSNNYDIDNLVEKGYETLKHLKEHIFSQYQYIPISNDDVFKIYETTLSNVFSKAPRFNDVYKIIKKTCSKSLKLGLCHGDYWIGNIIYKDSQIEGIIDLDKLSYNLPHNYDELHLYIVTYALSKGISNGQQIIYNLKSSKFNKNDIYMYWIVFLCNNIKSNKNILKNKMWINRNIENVISYILDNHKDIA